MCIATSIVLWSARKPYVFWQHEAGITRPHLLQSSANEGWSGFRRWVVLQDCHLAGPWLDTLQSALDELKGNPNLHDNFRLWLTTLPATNIPTELLHTRWGGSLFAQMSTQDVLVNFCRRNGTGRPSECVDVCEIT
jgi:hypothetical protein